MLFSVLESLCNEKGVSIFNLEKEIGVANGTIRKWKKSSPSVDKLLLVADYFGVSIDYLMGRTSIRKTADNGGLDDDVAVVVNLLRSDPVVRDFLLRQLTLYKDFSARREKANKESV